MLQTENGVARLGAAETKERYSVSMYPSDVRRIDEEARRYGVSRSAMLVFCFNLVTATGLDLKAGVRYVEQ